MICTSFFDFTATHKPRPRCSLFAIVFMGAALIGTPSSAHQTFLLPGQFVWNIGEPVEVALTSALSFPNLEHGPARDRISFAEVVVDNERVADISYEEWDTFLNVKFTAVRSGFAIIALSSKPRFGEINPEDSSDYFDEIGADEAVREAFNALPGSPPLNRSYSKHAKTFICIKICSPGREASFKPVEQALEFVAFESDKNIILLLRDGEPLANHAVKVSRPDDAVRELSTNEGGFVHINPSLEGVLMLTSVWITVPKQPDGIYHSDYATLTVDLSQMP